MRWNRKQTGAFLVLAIGILLTGCEGQKITTEDTSSADTTETVVPVGNMNYRKQLEVLPAVGAPIEHPGSRANFSFVANESQYIFTETETLWLYNQSMIGVCDTQFLLNVKGRKVTLVMPKAEELAEIELETWASVYSDDVVTIYRENDGKKVEENERMFLTLYDMTYQVNFWSSLVEKRVISLDSLYTQLAQMGTAITPATEGETLSDVITAMRVNPVFEDYKMAFREGLPYSGFIFCSPSSELANYDEISILMSVQIPEWGDYATIHIERVPDYQNRLEDSGETFDGYPILADYKGELKYFIIGEGGTCVYLDGTPGSAGNGAKNYTAKDAAYIFELVLTK